MTAIKTIISSRTIISTDRINITINNTGRTANNRGNTLKTGFRLAAAARRLWTKPANPVLHDERESCVHTATAINYLHRAAG